MILFCTYTECLDSCVIKVTVRFVLSSCRKLVRRTTEEKQILMQNNVVAIKESLSEPARNVFPNFYKMSFAFIFLTVSFGRIRRLA